MTALQWSRCAGLLCAALCVASSACALLPIHPSAPASQVADTVVDDKVTIAPDALSTSGELPAAGTADHAMLARHLAGQLNLMIGASDRAAVELPTRLALKHTKGAKRREELRIHVETRLPSGESVDTVLTAPWTPPADPFAFGGPAIGVACMPLLGCGSLPGFGCGGYAAPVACALAANPEAAALALSIAMAGTALVVAAVVVAIVGVQAARLGAARTTAFSDGLQRAMHMHALDIREHLSGRRKPVPMVPPQGSEPQGEADADAPPPSAHRR